MKNKKQILEELDSTFESSDEKDDCKCGGKKKCKCEDDDGEVNEAKKAFNSEVVLRLTGNLAAVRKELSMNHVTNGDSNESKLILKIEDDITKTTKKMYDLYTLMGKREKAK